VSTSLADRVVLITGTTSGLGRAAARLFVERGAKVVGMDLHPHDDPIAAVDGGSFSFVGGDHTNPDDCRRAVAATRDEHGRVDVLINNAARTLGDDRVEDMSDDDWRSFIEIDLTGPFFMSRAVLPTMQAQRDGVIINVGSFSSLQAVNRKVAYSSAKAGLMALTRALAVENAAFGVRANLVAPGSMKTEAWYIAKAARNMPAGEGTDGLLGAMRMDPIEVARAMALLASEDARAITGVVLPVDRGYSAGWAFATLLDLGAAGQLPERIENLPV